MRTKILLIFSLLWYNMTAWLPAPATASPLVGDNLAPVERTAAAFVADKLTDSHGVIVSAIELTKPTNFALSESMGQILLFAARNRENLLWDYYEPQVGKYFWQDGYYAWRINLADMEAERVSALVDDLRLAEAYMVQEENNPGKYMAQVKAISTGLLNLSTDENGNIGDFYAAGSGAADHVSLFYLRTATMDKLTAYDDRWQKVAARSKKILVEMPEKANGFYPKNFSFSVGEYNWGDDVSMVENIYTALFAAHIGRDTANFAAFLRRELERGKIYNRYNFNGEPSFAHDSVAVYALAARYFAKCGDKVSAETALDKMNKFFITGGKLNGAFGYRMLGTVYAFDQLEAMLTLTEKL